MGAPVAITNPDFGVRTITAYDLEVALVKFLRQIFDSARLDNPRVNVFQATAPEHPIVRDPDDPPVSYDPTQRAQTLFAKVPPQITRGRVPRTVTGEIDIQALPNVPSIIVQAISGKVETNSTIVEAKICVSAYDENPNSQGYQDVLNMIETATFALAAWGQKGIDDAYVIVLPMDWKLEQADTFPHFAGEIATKWELPTASPLPGPGELNVPGEMLDFKMSYPGATYPDPPPPYVPPAGPPPLVLLDSWPVEGQNDTNSYGVGVGGTLNPMIAAGQAFPCAGATLAAVKFSLSRRGNPTGNVFARVYAASGAFPMAKPTGVPLAESLPMSVDDVDPAATDLVGILYEFLFPGGVVLAAGNYCVLLETDGTYDNNNRVGLGCDFDFAGDPNPGHAGNFAGIYKTGGAAADDLCDAVFYLYTQ